MSTISKIAISGPGLKKQGIVVIQAFFIGFFTFIELWLRNGVGIITGVIILLSFFGGIRFGRPGTTYVATVTPPLAFAVVVIAFPTATILVCSRVIFFRKALATF